jgi:Tfp pilus assembly protein PilO
MTGRSNQRKQDALIWATHALGAACLVGLALAAWWVNHHLHQEWTALAQEEAHDRLLLVRAAELRTELHDAARRLGELEASLDERRARLPHAVNEAAFLGQCSDLAERFGVKLNTFRPGKPSAAGNLSCCEIQLGVGGQYADLCALLSGLAELPRFLTVSRLSLAGPHAAGGPCLADVTIRLYFSPQQKLAGP